MKRQYSILEISKCLKLPESMTRKLLNDAGAGIDELAENLGEPIRREIVINLAADRAGTREGRLLAKLLH